MGNGEVTPSYVVDTHALFWYLTNPTRLSLAARQVFASAIAGSALLVLSPIVLIELYALVRKLGAPVDFAAELEEFQAAPYFRIEEITINDLLLLDQLEDIPEMHDRVIAAMAVRLGAIVLTVDKAIQNSVGVKSLW